jgi:NAD(P)-dependent dehydrogenase (short-subunit alcohol dehydrogenase family)
MSVAFVTGAAGDIGRAICTTLLEHAINVAAIDANEARLREFAAAVTIPSARLLPLVADVTQMASVRAAADRARTELGTVGILINNAGAISTASIATTTEEDWLRDIDLNLNGPWRCIKVLQPQLFAAGSGTIVNIASVNGLQIYGHPGYSVAKAGLIHLTRFCAVEFGRHGVRSIAVCPGSVKTRAWEQRRAAHPEILDEVATWYPSRNTCRPEDVANLVLAMVGGQMSLVNGAVITLDGGLTAGSDRLASMFAGEVI